MITVQCPSCGRKIMAADKYAGLKAHCPACKSEIFVPWPVMAQAVPEKPVAQERSRVRHWFPNVVGESFDNDDGSSRQKIIRACKPMEQLALVREPNNPHDANAIAVKRQNGQQLGYLPRELAKETISTESHGYRHAVFFYELVGSDDFRYKGAKLLMIVGEPGATLSDMQKYLDANFH